MIAHYVRRFFTVLSPRAPSEDDEHWAAGQLSDHELLLFRRLDNHDRRHLIHSARMVARDLGPGGDPVWVRAALLHDVGKFDSHFGVFGRVATTVLAGVVGADRVRGWARTSGWRGRVGSYQLHGEIGAAEIRAAGGPEEAAVWSELHHHPDRFPDSSIPPEYLKVLAHADR